MKDDSGSYAVFTEQGSSASPMTAAKVMGYHFPDCQVADGQAADAVSAQIIENSKIGVSQTCGFVYQNTNGLNHGPVWKTQSFLLSEMYGHPLAGLLREKQFEKILLKTWLGESFQLGMFLRTP